MLRVLLCSVALFVFLMGSPGSAQKTNDDKTKSAAKEARRRPSDVVFLLIETSGADTESVEELQRLYDVLRKLDKNKDGKIDLDELKTARLQIVEDRIDHIMKKLDTDGDGRISKEEAKGRIKEHFERLDMNNDGYISRDELRQAISARQKAPAKDAPAKDAPAKDAPTKDAPTKDAPTKDAPTKEKS